VLEALGVRIDLTPEEAAHSLREQRFAFFFAPQYHPAFKHIAPARKLCADRGQRTIFNFLGPLLNPVRPSAQLVGVPRPQLCEPIARVLQILGVRRAMVVSGQVPGRNPDLSARPGMAGPNDSPCATPDAQSSYLDELSTLGDNTIAEFYQDRALALSTVGSSVFSFRSASLQDLAGGNREENARIVLALLAGKERGPKRDAVLLNAGAALFVAGRVRSQIDGLELAAEIIDSGCALAKLNELREGREGAAP
jgi:anthranilate phosphoribosyltransferase